MRASNLLMVLIASSFLLGCSKAQRQAPNDFLLTLSDQQLMAHIVEPAAEHIWDSSGSIITAAGEESLAPTDEEGWLQAVAGAATLMESANLLLLPGRHREEPEWQAFAAALHTTAGEAHQAALGQSEPALFEAGAAVYQVCLGCHRQYALEQIDPTRAL